MLFAYQRFSFCLRIEFDSGMVDRTSSLRIYRAVGRCPNFIVLCDHVTTTMAAIVRGSLATRLIAQWLRSSCGVRQQVKSQHVNSALLFISLYTFIQDLVSLSLHFLYGLRCQDTSRLFRSQSQPLLLQATN